ncbi:GldM family protein, partial [Bacteroidota bacterium]
GDVFEATVFLSAADTTQDPQIIVGNTNLPVQDGKAIFRQTTSGIGMKNFGGVIKYISPDGSTKNYPFEIPYEVAEPSLVVSPTAMNVLFMGIPAGNPIAIAVPGIQPDELIVQLDKGEIRRNGDNWLAFPNERNGIATITVSSEINGERKVMGTEIFRLKRLPDPIATVASLRGGKIAKESLLAQRGVIATLENFFFELQYVVTGFTFTVINNQYADDEISDSWLFTEKQKEMIGTLRRGQRVYIESIKCEGPDKIERELGTISFIIN